MNLSTPAAARSRRASAAGRAAAPGGAERGGAQAAARLFAVFDTDGSGEISAGELRDGLRALGLRPANRDVLAMIRQVDLKRGAERDGCVDEDEFLLALLGRNSRLHACLYDEQPPAFAPDDGGVSDEQLLLDFSKAASADEKRKHARTKLRASIAAQTGADGVKGRV